MQQISFQDVLQTSTVIEVKLGSKACTPDGNIWVYQGINTVACLIGHLLVPVAVTTLTTVSSSTGADGKTSVLTKAAAGWTAGQFQDAYVLVNAGTGSGQVAKVRDNDATNLYLYTQFALGTALDGTSGFAIWTQYLTRKSLTSTKVQNATGLAQVAFPASSYGWVLKEGIGTAIADTALTIGKDFVSGGGTAGEVTVGTTAKGGFDEQPLGVCIVANSGNDLGALVQATM